MCLSPEVVQGGKGQDLPFISGKDQSRIKASLNREQHGQDTSNVVGENTVSSFGGFSLAVFPDPQKII
jgi:hypothetical protein